MQQVVPWLLLTNHLLEQEPISFPKKDTEIQNLGDIKQEVIVNNFSKDRGSDKMILQRQEKKSNLMYNPHLALQ